jgi:hypothetical protein
MLPVEFVVPGVPVSTQTRNRQRLQAWKGQVRSAATGCVQPGEEPVTRRVIVTIVYYFTGASLDTDNMIKPIQDALKGVVYVDDGQVTDVRASVRSLDGSFKVRGMSAVLAGGFVGGSDFVHVRVADAPDEGEPIWC